jgi:N-acetylmuramic acid 6-phosphate etherase
MMAPAVQDPAPTERVSARYRDFDAWAPGEILASLWEAQAAAVAATRSALPEIERLAHAALPRLQAGGRLIYAGAGTSARIAAQDAAELTPTFGWPAPRAPVLVAGGAQALAVAVEGAEDNRQAAREDVARHEIGNADVLVGIAASGTTPFTVECVAASRARGALTAAVTCAPGSALAVCADHAIVTPTGAEPIAGSTRLKAGTAQKIVLNLLSTLLMTKLGGVHDGLMVDMQASNEKLRRRAAAMVCGVAGCAPADADAALARSGGNVKRAILLLRVQNASRVDALLAEAGGSLRAALALAGQGASGAGP